MPKNEKLENFNDPDAIPGVVCKTASVSSLECTDSDLKKINRYTLEPVTAEDVFVFKATMCDNEQDDRNFMPFDLKSLQDLKKLYVGKTMLKDHNRMADNQIGRIFDTELVQDSAKMTDLGELHTELVAKAYMIRTASNADLIKEIAGGIKKEVSTSCMPEKMVCNICGRDNMKDYCSHYPGMEYETKDANGRTTKTRCKLVMSGCKEAYELSLVAVPAQPRASTRKCIGFTKPVLDEKATMPVEIEESTKIDKEAERLANLRFANVSAIFNAEKGKEEI